MSSTQYLRSFLVVFVVAGAVIFTWARTDLFPWIGACSGAGYSEDHYLAYCEYGRYGDYEHGALLYGLEPEALEPIKRADVLFLGNSRTQYTFSSEPVVDAMNATGRPWYVMGFGFGAKSEMPQAMFAQHGLKPKMLVINADPFFNAEPSGISRKIIDGDDAIVAEYGRKRWLQGLHQNLCANWQDSALAPVLCGSAPTLFRARSNGTWNVEHYRPDRHIAVTYSDHLLDQVDETAAAAEAFFDAVDVPRDCVVLTVLPQRPTPLDAGRALADTLGITFVAPELDDLWTIDASHMDVDSNVRWSSEFMQTIAPQMAKCLQL